MAINCCSKKGKLAPDMKRRRKVCLAAAATAVFSIAAIVGAIANRIPPPCADFSVPINCAGGALPVCSDGAAFDGPTAGHPWHHKSHPCGRHSTARVICSKVDENADWLTTGDFNDNAQGDVFQTQVANCVASRVAMDAVSTTAAATATTPSSSSDDAAAPAAGSSQTTAACVADMGADHAAWCAKETGKVQQQMCEAMVQERLSPRCDDGALPRSTATRVQMFLHLDEHWHHVHEHGNEHNHEHNHERHHPHRHGCVAKILACVSFVTFLFQLYKLRKEQRQEGDGEESPLGQRLLCFSGCQKERASSASASQHAVRWCAPKDDEGTAVGKAEVVAVPGGV